MDSRFVIEGCVGECKSATASDGRDLFCGSSVSIKSAPSGVETRSQLSQREVQLSGVNYEMGLPDL